MEYSANKKLTRGSTLIAGGVCAGLAKYYGISKGGVQAGFVIGSLFFWSYYFHIFNFLGHFT